MNSTFLIENDILEQAQEITKYISEDFSRDKATANAFAAIIAKKFFEDTEVDTESGLYKNPTLLENLEIADIYIKNNYIDVRIYFNDNELCVPISHFEHDISPIAYMFIKLDSDLSSGDVTGFVLPSSIDTSKAYGNYYKVKESDLVSFYDIEPLITENFTTEIDEDFELQIFNYVDNKLDNLSYFYKVLLTSKEAREKLYNASKAKRIFNLITLSDKENIPQDTEQEYLEEDQDSVIEGCIDDSPEEIESIDLGDNLTEIIDATDKIDEQDLLEETTASEVLDTDENSDDLDLLEIEDTLVEELSDGVELLEENDDFIAIVEDDNIVSEIQLEEDCNDELELFENQEITLDESISLNQENFEETIENNVSLEDSSAIEFRDVAILDDDLKEQKDDTVELVTDSSFEYSTVTTPSITSIENTEDENDESFDENSEPENTTEETLNLNELLNNESAQDNDEISNSIKDDLQLLITEEDTEETKNVSSATAKEEEEEISDSEIKESEIETLFKDNSEALNENELYSNDVNIEESSQEDYSETYPNATEQKRNNKVLPLLSILVLASALGYYGYSRFFNSSEQAPPPTIPTENKQIKSSEKNNKTTDAMPVETIENIKKVNNKNEGNAIDIPAIEQNLDASILVSNLSIEWEVPATYATNNTAKRYFMKLGKIIQLNLKSELLLLNKPPITNKIMVELEYNPAIKNFDIKGFVTSSGEKVVDDLITKTVKNALNINLNINLTNFENISGNPSLIIRL